MATVCWRQHLQTGVLTNEVANVPPKRTRAIAQDCQSDFMDCMFIGFCSGVDDDGMLF